MERTVTSKKTDINKKGGGGAKSNQEIRSLERFQKPRTLNDNDHSVVEEAHDARKVNLKLSCQTNLGEIREGENLHLTQCEVTIPGTLGRYLGDEYDDPLPHETQPDVPLTFHMGEQKCRIFIVENTRIWHPGAMQFLSAKTRETDVPKKHNGKHSYKPVTSSIENSRGGCSSAYWGWGRTSQHP